jgi:DNA-binding protein HU-beta
VALLKKQVTGLIDGSALAVKQAKKSGAFVLPGIGKVALSNRKARIGENPRTGEPIKIAATPVVRIRAARPLKEAILGGKRYRSSAGGMTNSAPIEVVVRQRTAGCPADMARWNWKWQSQWQFSSAGPWAAALGFPRSSHEL